MSGPRPIALRTGFSLTRATPFSYECRACNRCCHGKAIPVNPYEIARLAAALGTSTTEVLARYTSTGGATITTRDDGACVFLGERGCEVHEGRPLACRLYPLGRSVTPGGEESFAEVVPHPESEGVYGGGEGTVEAWLSAQGAAPFIDATARYVAVLKRMIAALARRADAAAVRDEAAAAMERAPEPEDESWLDVDAVVSRRCRERGEAVPADVAARVEMHLAALEEMIARLDI